jgi:hypothetical protein
MARDIGRVASPLPGTQLFHQGRVVVPADEVRAGEQVGVEGQVGLGAGDAEGRDRVPGARQGLVPVGACTQSLASSGS